MFVIARYRMLGLATGMNVRLESIFTESKSSRLMLVIWDTVPERSSMSRPAPLSAQRMTSVS